MRRCPNTYLTLSFFAFHFLSTSLVLLCQPGPRAKNTSNLSLRGTNNGCDVDLRMCASVNIWLCLGESPGGGGMPLGMVK